MTIDTVPMTKRFILVNSGALLHQSKEPEPGNSKDPG